MYIGYVILKVNVATIHGTCNAVSQTKHFVLLHYNLLIIIIIIIITIRL